MHSVVAAFGKLMSAARGEVLCSVTTAKVCNSCQDYMLFALSCVCSMVLLDDFFLYSFCHLEPKLQMVL